jgi:hypothetical protein
MLISFASVRAVPREVYARIKRCEDRIMELEQLASCADFLAFLKARKKEQRGHGVASVGEEETT